VRLRFAFPIVLALSLTACEGWLVPEPTLPAWDTPVAISAATTAPPSFGASATLETPTVTPTITLTPRLSPTPPIAVTATLSSILTTATAGSGVLNTPIIDYFVVVPTEARSGDILQFFWKTRNGTAASIWRVKADGAPGQTWAVPLEGSKDIITDAAGRTERYILSVTNGHRTVELSAEVEVSCEGNWFFDPPPEEGCPEADPQFTAAVFQGFERGQMFWLQATNQIVVLFNDGGQPAWVSVGNTFADGMPEDDPALVPPEGQRQPRRELGKAWRETPGVRDRLGWALGDPVPYNATYQRVRYDGGDLGLYFNDTVGAVIELLPDGKSWNAFSP
jgi:hypothetical protein